MAAKKVAAAAVKAATKPTVTVSPSEIEQPWLSGLKVKVTLTGFPVGSQVGVKFPIALPGSPHEPEYQLQSTIVKDQPAVFEFPFGGRKIELTGGTRSVIAGYVENGFYRPVLGGNITVW
jgi:hypothetical protein